MQRLLTSYFNLGSLYCSELLKPPYVIGGCSLRSVQLFISPCTSTSRTVTHSVHWQVANWMEI